MENELKKLINGATKKDPDALERFLEKQIENIVESGVLIDFGTSPEYLQNHMQKEVVPILLGMNFANGSIPFVVVPSLRRQNVDTEVDPRQRLYDIGSKLELDNISDRDLGLIRTAKPNFYIITNVIVRKFNQSTIGGTRKVIGSSAGINLEEFIGLTIQFPEMLENNGVVSLLGEWKNDQCSNEKKDTIYNMGYERGTFPNMWWFHNGEIRENLTIIARDVGLVVIK